MIHMVYPEPEFRMKVENDRRYIFDIHRKIWLILTEEEWVRQNFLSALVKNHQYPSSMIAVEKEISLHGLKKRFDILVYNSQHHPWMLVECKAPEVELNEKTLQQALVYHQAMPVQYIIITNGQQTVGWMKQEGRLLILSELPSWMSSSIL
jgi:type I site-specific restriction endonuclease